jgi:hypothetical protein
VAINVNGQRAWEHVLLGEGTIRIVERGVGRKFADRDSARAGGRAGGVVKDEAWVSYEGEIQAVPPPSGAEIDVGGFIAKDLRVSVSISSCFWDCVEMRC